MPNDYDSWFEDAGRQYNVDPQLLRVIASAESSDNPNAVGPQTPYGQAAGIMQLTAPTAKSLGVTDRTDPKQSIYGAAKLISGYLDKYGNPTQAIAAYYGGPDQTKWGPKTNAYVQKVSGLYGKPQMSSAGQSISDQDLLNALMGKPTSSHGQPQPNAPGDISDDQLISALTAGAKTPPKAQARNVPQPQASAPDTPFGNLTRQAGLTGRYMIEGAASPFTALADLAEKPINAVLPKNYQFPEQNQALSNILTKFGLPQPQGGLENVVGTASRALSSVGSGLGIAGLLSKATNPAVASLGQTLSQSPVKQAVSAGLGGSAEGVAKESGASPSTQLAVGLGASLIPFAGSVLPTSPGINAARAGLAQTAVDKFGIPLRWSQISEAPFAKYLDSVIGKLPLSGLAKSNSAQATAFTRGIASTFGETADALTPEVMSHARDRIGNMFNQVAQNTTIGNTDDLLTKLGNVVSEAQQTLPEGTASPLLKQVENIGSVIDPQSKTISGQAYQALTRKGAPLDRAMNSNDSNIRYYAGQIKSTLDDALESSASPQDLQTLKNARLQWKNMRTVQDIASKAGIEGEISPAALLGAVKKSYKDMAYSGAGDIGNLANVGQEFLKDQPSSGTGERTLLHYLIGAGGAGVTEAAFGDPNALLHTGGLMAGMAATGHGIGNVLRSKMIRDIMLRNALRQGPQPGLLSQPLGLPTGAVGLQSLSQQPAQ